MSTNKLLIAVCTILVVVILGLGGYYLYSSGTLSKLGFSNNSKTGAPTGTPFPTPVKQAVRQDITSETDFGSCADLKDSPLISKIDLVEKGQDYILIGILRGKIQSLVTEPGFGQFNLVPENGGSASKLIKFTDKNGMIGDTLGKKYSVGDLNNGQVVNVDFNCTRTINSNNFVTLRVTIDNGDGDH